MSDRLGGKNKFLLRNAPVAKCVALLLAVPASGATPCLGATLEIGRLQENGTVRIEVEDQRVETVIGKLANRFEFQFIAPANTLSDTAVTTTREGTLLDIISHLLRSHNYILTFSGRQKRVMKVKLFENRVGTPPQRRPQQTATFREKKRSGIIELRLPGRVPVPINPVPGRPGN